MVSLPRVEGLAVASLANLGQLNTKKGDIKTGSRGAPGQVKHTGNSIQTAPETAPGQGKHTGSAIQTAPETAPQAPAATHAATRTATPGGQPATPGRSSSPNGTLLYPGDVLAAVWARSPAIPQWSAIVPRPRVCSPAAYPQRCGRAPQRFPNATLLFPSDAGCAGCWAWAALSAIPQWYGTGAGCRVLKP